MVRFAHLADVHLGGWKQQPLQDLNMNSFRKAVEVCILEKVEFVLIAGDLFDTAYPGIEILKETFAEFRKLKEAGIPCFIIAGSHDYSVSGKTFLDVLEKAGFCKNVENYEQREDGLLLNPVVYKNVALYGYPGRKAGLEINDLRKIKLNESPGLFKIFMLHTTLDKARGTLPVDAIEIEKLPKADYYALGHLHMDFHYENFIYPGPLFPNNFQELEDLQFGTFYIVNTDAGNSLRKVELKIKDVELVRIRITNALSATEKIILELSQRDIKDKIILLRLSGNLEQGKRSDIKFQTIEDFVKQKGAYFILRNLHELKEKEVELNIEVKETGDIEEEAVKIYSDEHPSNFNEVISRLMHNLDIEKQEGETTTVFETRVLENVKNLLKI